MAMRCSANKPTHFGLAWTRRRISFAADTLNKRRDYDPEIKKTILLPTSKTNDEMTEAMRMVRGQDRRPARRTSLTSRPSSINRVRDTPQNVALPGHSKDVHKQRANFFWKFDLRNGSQRRRPANLGITPPTSGRDASS